MKKSYSIDVRKSITLTVGLLLICPAGTATAETYPSKPIHLIVPYAAGGTTDIVGRAFALELGKRLGQPVVVDNRGGAGGMIGAAAVARAEADGYTLGIATVSTLATAPLTSRTPSYDPLVDFSPISLIAFVPNVVTVNPKIPAKTLSEFIALLRVNPGKYSYATSGVGSIAHLDGELFKRLTKTDITHVPYRGSGPALSDTVAGQVAAQFDNVSSSLTFIRAGKLRALAVASDQRLPELKDVPTYAEAGLPEMNNMAWFGLVGPKNLPSLVNKALADASNNALRSPELIAALQRNGAIPQAISTDKFVQIIKKEYNLRRKIVESQNITVD
ncbi:Tripartite-type tricarboxylate transporter, receptor component TctC [Cupriavidus sp. YR651]|uniref:Bug family tripartite tricarboxylate transporter substrate binding protein n=1 Tax=Cupriavidus sp. YR651 TaxID=1855315 RepID=UPI00088E2E28|nr:tripartite tricarboxylate transporter substrate-binding protein [Cupriavidus sp. YR651]SDD82993.1 Tripartite-type tricarboxylate transporter, receptor component TctC [Cupriavidus sp. YR651]